MLKQRTHTSYTLDDRENSFPIPFGITETATTPMIHISHDGLQAVVACLAQDQDAPDPRNEFDFWADAEVTAWETGEVYGVMCWRYTRPTQLSPWELDEESRDSECWGYYGYGYALGELTQLFNEATELLPPGTPDPRD